jgi:hypothetical protein
MYGKISMKKLLDRRRSHGRQTSMSSAGFEPFIPAIEQSQSYALDRTAIDIA